MTIQPLFDSVHVRIQEDKRETDGGIVIPSTHSADRPQRGTVLSVGPKCETVKEGDDVLFKTYSPDVIMLGEEKITLLSEKDILAIVK